jgi:hypothetical protein
MAKNDGTPNPINVKDFLASLPQLPSVYDAKDFTNRPFRLNRVEWKVFEANSRNNYNTTEKIMMHATELATGKELILESTQKGIVQPVAAIEENGLFPCDLMIIQEGKYCTITAR